MGREPQLVANRYEQFIGNYWPIFRDIVVASEKAARVLADVIKGGRVVAGNLPRLKRAKEAVEEGAAALVALAASSKGGPVLQKEVGSDGTRIYRGAKRKAASFSFSSSKQPAVSSSSPKGMSG